ncbi:hypothetical protein [Thiomicrorhabdus indica]|uniref:hypothetical protein n=1 Tax=Thiomicrorhabdus indica TaxID=2267253 RepID=UPI00102DEC0B|nr:hypothetical protein [Thiomicrorhabdus indica]
MKLRSLFLGVALGLSAFAVQAQIQTLPATQFQDANEQTIELTPQTKWVLLSSEKAAGKAVKESLEALEITDVEAVGGLYIADVSAMPGFITKLFAIPKMQDYSFRMAVVNDETQLQGWPKKEDHVTAMKLNNLYVESVEYFDNAEALQAWIKAQK